MADDITPYGMSRIEFTLRLEELVIQARPDVSLKNFSLQSSMTRLEELLFGIEPVKPKDDGYAGNIT